MRALSSLLTERLRYFEVSGEPVSSSLTVVKRDIPSQPALETRYSMQSHLQTIAVIGIMTATHSSSCPTMKSEELELGGSPGLLFLGICLERESIPLVPIQSAPGY